MARTNIAAMHRRIKKGLANKEVYARVLADWVSTFTALGLEEENARECVEYVLFYLRLSVLKRIEKQIFSDFSKSGQIGEKSILELLEEKLADRASIIYNQIWPHLQAVGTPVVDFGCGDGQVTQRLKDGLFLNVTGYDVRRYPAPHVAVPIKRFNGKRIRCRNGYFDAGVMTNVLHHEVENQHIIDELTRIIRKGGRLVVIETVPVKDDPIEFEVTFFNDYLYNRLFHNADIPVPGTYETTEGWKRRFTEAGWTVETVQELGYDQPTIKDWHVLLILTKV